jgi:beta-galactosidase
MALISRRQFVQQTTGIAVAASAYRLLPCSIVHAMATAPETSYCLPLDLDWEFLRMPLAGPFEVWADPPLAPWSAATLPHCFNAYDACDPDVPAYRGKGWYRNHLKLNNPYPNGRTLLHFEGAGQTSEVYIGDTLAGRHIGGYDEFVIDITDPGATSAASDKAGLRLSVLCDNAPDLERMPSDFSDFTLYGGIYRHVHLVYVPAVSLERVHVVVHAEAGEAAKVSVMARLYMPGSHHSVSSAHVELSITDPHGAEVHRSSFERPLWNGTIELRDLSLSEPLLWSPAAPNLYQCRVSLRTTAGESVQVERFGVRFYTFAEHGPFLLNGERLLIRGTHRHEDHAGYAAATPAEVIRKEMQAIKAMGANFIRLGHYQQQRLVLDLCDELGLLVWEELPWCRAGVGDENFRQQGREKLTTMIDQHHNHPSIILWGLGNEDDWPGEFPTIDEQSIRSYMLELHQLAHRLDDTRLTSFRRCDFARDIPDVYSPSIWAGWYAGRFTEYQSSLEQERKKSLRMLHVEWGADAHARRHAEDPYKMLTHVVVEGDTSERGLAYLEQGGNPRVSRDGDWSESYACDLYDWYLKVQESLPWLTGAVHWTFKDFATPLRPENPVPRINQKGVVERDLTPKEGYFVFQSYWAERPMVHIYGHTWPVRWGPDGHPRTVKVYSNCPQVELFVNGVSAGMRNREIQNFPAAGLRWDVPFKPGMNVLRAVATSAGETVTDELSFQYQTAPSATPDHFVLSPVEQTSNLITIEAKLLDSGGNLCVEARDNVRFTLAGAGQLRDNQGTSTGSRVVQLYNGRARISIVRGRGSLTAAVAADGVPTALCTL